jgi:hypothetical protein
MLLLRPQALVVISSSRFFNVGCYYEMQARGNRKTAAITERRGPRGKLLHLRLLLLRLSLL